MPLPTPDREMLLSAALDGELSVQEQAEFDRLLVADSTFAEEFQSLQSLRSDLRLGLAELRWHALPVGATERIVAAAMASGLSSGAASVTPVQPLTRSDRGKWAAVFVLAASMMIAVTIWSRQTPTSSIARVEPQPPVETITDHDTNRPPDGEPPTQAAVVDVESIASEAVEDRSQPKVMSIKPVPKSAQAQEPLAQAVATSDVARETEMDTTIASGSPERARLKVVLLLAVELTQQGRDQLALQEALRATDIRLGQESVMGSEVVTHLQQANVIDSVAGSDPISGKLYFIEASAKRIDRLMTYLMSNQESFAAVGLSLADNPPLLAAVSDLREIDPTNVRQSGDIGRARDLVAADGKALAVDPAHLFLPLDRDTVDSGLLRAANSDPNPNGSANVVDDFPSQLLLFVK